MKKRKRSRSAARLPTIDVTSLPSASQSPAPVPNYGWHNGDKFTAGFGDTLILTTDYWTLRQRSGQLFKTNIYARGIIQRLITNEINTGLNIEAIPEEEILGLKKYDLEDWTEDIENRFNLWAQSPQVCDLKSTLSFGALQAQVRAESLIEGDVLVTLIDNPVFSAPTVGLYRGSSVQTPIYANQKTRNKIKHGVEVDAIGRHVAYWVRQEDGTSRRLPAWGETSGRRIAWLVYGGLTRIDEVRGEPLLAIALQSLREIDRYRDSVQRKALVNSMLAYFIEKSQDKRGSLSLTGGISRNQQTTTVDQESGIRRTAVEQIPGWVIQELQVGETVKAHGSGGTDEKFGDFEQAIVSGVSWGLEVPPEILTLSFNSNYSASQAAINEFRMYLDKARKSFGESFCAPIYQDWLISEVLNKRVNAPGFINAWRNKSSFYEFAAWTLSDWNGHIKPSTDIYKQIRGLAMAVEHGATTYEKMARDFNGSKFTKNMRKQKRELQLLKENGIIPEHLIASLVGLDKVKVKKGSSNVAD